MRINVPICEILGVKIAAINMEWLMDFTKNNLERMRGQYICVTNVHATVTAYEDCEYKEIQNTAALAIPDGGPLSTVGRRRGFREMERTTGPSYMEEVFKCSSQYGWKHFFYGSTQETLDKLEKELKMQYPGIEIVGMFSPPFREVSREEDDAIIKMINESKPDFIWVGLGAPKQEKWMYQHKEVLNGMMIGVGAGFDYHAGNIKRAPKWMQNKNLEWLYRLFQDPRRLFSRYLKTNTKFIWHAIIKGK